MLSEVNIDLYTLSEDAANEIVGHLIEALNAHFDAQPVPALYAENRWRYTDFLVRRAGYCGLENIGSVYDRAMAFAKEQLAALSLAEKFALTAFVMEMIEKVPVDYDDPSPENEVVNLMPDDASLAEYIVTYWEECLLQREYDDEPNDVVVSPSPVGDTCPYCGGKVLPIVYGEPSNELFDKAANGEVILGGCIVTENDPQKECAECGFQFLEVDEKN